MKEEARGLFTSQQVKSPGYWRSPKQIEMWLWLFIQIALYTLNEAVEVLSIQVKHIDLAKQVIFILKAKAGAREQHITARLADFLEELMKSLEAGQEFLFPAKKP